ncbi:MAG: hypothetical protein EB015_14220 [Methylocystaceae bacterium]|nr:hypothetical protein [Methylocystaceae bacterium]
MTNLLGGRLVFNAQDNIWDLCDLTGMTKNSDFAGIKAERDPAAQFQRNAVLWGGQQNGETRDLNWKSSVAPYPASYHFGRLGYYARSVNVSSSAGMDKSAPHYLRAGFAGFSLAFMSSTALVNPVIAGNILPQGGVVASGSGSINTVNNGAGLQIKQNSQVLGLNWNSFSIGAGNKVVFDQPSSTSVAVNRVVGNSRSETHRMRSAMPMAAGLCLESAMPT